MQAAQPSATRALPAIDSFFLLLFLLPMTLDYRAEQPSGALLAFQISIMVLSMIGAGALLLRSRGLPQALALCFGAVGVFMVAGIFSSLYRGDEAGLTLRAAAPMLELLGALAVTMSLASRGAPIREVWRLVLIAAALAVIARPLIYIPTHPFNLYYIRDGVLSQGAPVLSALLVAALLVGGLTLAEMAVLTAHVVIILISVTRTQVAILGFELVVLVAATGLKLMTPWRLGRLLAGLAAMAVFVTAAGPMIPGDPLQHWTQRVFRDERQLGIDATAITRKAEATYQIRRLQETPSNLMFGRGIGADSYLDAQIAQVVSMRMGYGSTFRSTAFGHNNFVGIFHIGGLIFGTVLLLPILYASVAGLRVLRRLPPDRILLSIPLSLAGWMAHGALAGTLQNRQAGMFFGMSMAMTIWLWGQYRPRAAPSRARLPQGAQMARRY